MPLYLIHFERPLAHARHYLGFVEGIADLPARLAEHKAGRGARLLQVLKERDIPWKVTRVWIVGDRTAERHLKDNAMAPRLCPCCGGPKAHDRMSNLAPHMKKKGRKRNDEGHAPTSPA